MHIHEVCESRLERDAQNKRGLYVVWVAYPWMASGRRVAANKDCLPLWELGPLLFHPQTFVNFAGVMLAGWRARGEEFLVTS
jgi:hypothetical protein